MSGTCGSCGEGEVGSKLPVPEKRQEARVRVPGRRRKVGSGGGGGQLASLPRAGGCFKGDLWVGEGLSCAASRRPGVDIALLPKLL